MLDRETLNRVRDAQLDALERWVKSPEAAERYAERLEAVVDHLEAQPLSQLVDREAIERLLDAIARPELAEAAAEPVARALAAEITTRLAARGETLGALAGPMARDEAMDLAARADILNEALLRAVVQDPAVETMLRDILYDALHQFQGRVNPFAAEWGVPALINAMPRLSRGPLTKALAGVRGEFERRLDPEMRKFLERFAARSLDRVVTKLLDSAGEPDPVALRRQVVSVLFEQPLSSVVFTPPDRRGEHLVAAIAAAVRHAMMQPALKEMVQTSLDARLATWSERPVREAREALGIARPELRPLADATWPLVRAALLAPALRAQAAEVIDAAHEQLLALP